MPRYQSSRLSRSYNTRMFNAKAPRYRARVYRGRGDYKSTLGSIWRGAKSIWKPIQWAGKTFIPKGTFSKIGQGIGGGIGLSRGGVLGGSKGAAIGGALGNLLSSAVGFGDYNVRKNTLMTEGGGDLPSINNGLRSNIIRHREYIQDIFSNSVTGVFQNESFPLNPGMSQTFPWLANIAQNYQEYMFRGVIFEYKTTSADALNSTNTALGTVVMSSDYNVLNASFVSKQQMENSEFANSSKPSCSFLHPIECDPKQTPVDRLFVRSSAVNASDLRFNDLCNFQIATVGMQGAGVNIGELWVTYEVEFYKPIQIPQDVIPAGSPGNSVHFELGATASSGVTGSTPVGTGLTTDPVGGNMAAVLLGSTYPINPNSLYFAANALQYGLNYMMIITWGGGNATCVAPNITYSSGIANISLLLGDTSPLQGIPNVQTSNKLVQIYTFTLTSPLQEANAQYITWGLSSTLPTSVSSTDIYVMSLNFSV